jgi:hypothetical protein
MDMQSGLTALIEKAKADYLSWMTIADTGPDHIQSKFIDEYNSQIRIEEGSKYFKVIQRNSVHSFVVKKDGGKFRAGDILKPASWRAPATNFARGNVLDGTLDRIRWTGAL